MRRSTLTICALLTVATFGCDSAKEKLKLAWDKVRGKPPAPATAPPATPGMPTGDTALAGRPATQQPARQQAQRPQPPPPRPPGQSPALRDVPFISNDTGTIAPGMGEREIYAVWGEAAAVRRVGDYSYLFFQNGCEYTCGTMDVVTLQNDSVVDAIVRWHGHRYAGESSSPPGKKPFPNPGGDTLRVVPPND
ncbi:MAG TPA: hypothetical protein VEK86_03320 [Gemmatimonadales bacterium]|nr:hypothetical protein [Gemmatimonadales bacterium]